MRKFRHWTPRYVRDRLSLMLYARSYPDVPWLTKTANLILSSYLKGSDIGLEFGSGRSTLWLAMRVSHLTSVEHNKDWYDRLSKSLKKQQMSNVRLCLRERDVEDEENGFNSGYVQVVEEFRKGSLDFVLVDGIYRSACACSVLEKIRPTGILIIDNANWYLPCNSSSPNSRTFTDGPASRVWAEFLGAVGNWRHIWTSNGVTDTTFYLKPS